MLQTMFHPHRIALGLAYFAAASLAVGLTRFGGGVAFLWIASSLLIADLMARPRRQWLGSLLPCAIASGMATGLFGLGWQAALPFIAINMLEAGLAAWIFRRYGQPLRPLGSLAWLWRFVLTVGVVAPLVGATLAAATLWALGKSPGLAFVHFFVGHALGNITLTPLAIMLTRGNVVKTFRDGRRRDTVEGVLLLSLVLATSAFVFVQPSLPLLFLPILPIILVTFRVGRGGAAIAIVLLALVGGGATLAGLGPIQLIEGSSGLRMQFFQFFLAATVLTVLPVAADLANGRRLHRAVRLSEQRYRVLADHSTDILLHFDLDGRIRFVSPSIRQVGGHDPAALIGRNVRTLVAPEHLERVLAEHAATIAAAGATNTYEYLALAADGSPRWCESNGRAIVDEEGVVESVLTIVRDISARKAIESRLAADALTDPLTGLPNRRAFDAAVSRRLLAAPGHRGDCVAILDLDHFKVINDSFGHHSGDGVLRDFAKVARRMIREDDFVARIGGEEFAIFFPHTALTEALLVCDRLRLEMAHTDILIGSTTVRVTVSGGVGEVGPEGMEHALRIADEALYAAKRNGRDQLARAA